MNRRQEALLRKISEDVAKQRPVTLKEAQVIIDRGIDDARSGPEMVEQMVAFLREWQSRHGGFAQ